MLDTASSDIISEARNWIGTSYHHQPSAKGIGCDLSWRGAWRLARTLYGAEPADALLARLGGGAAPRDASRCRHMVVVDPAAIAPGHVLHFALNERAPAKHCAIITTPDRMIHIVTNLTPVVEVTLSPVVAPAHPLRLLFRSNPDPWRHWF